MSVNLPAAASSTSRMAKVIQRTQQLRILFELERDFARCVSALIPRLGRLEMKFLVAQHAWEAMDHARYLRERGRELAGFGSSDTVRNSIRRLCVEALFHESAEIALAGFYRVIKPALHAAYVRYQESSDALADWATQKLIDEFRSDERRHAQEVEPFNAGVDADEWCRHLRAALACTPEIGGSVEENGRAAFAWQSEGREYRHPSAPARAGIGQNNSVFGDDAAQHIVHDATFYDPKTDARVIRIMIYVWLMNELTAVETLATVHFDTPELSFEMHFDLARHVWDEARHTQFGYRQLPRVGIDLARLNIHDLPYRSYQRISPAERYARLTCVAEADSFEIKAHIMDRVRELNDFEADTLLAFDRSDEQNHVRYGHRWVPHLMKREGITMAPDAFVAHSRDRFNAARAELSRDPDIVPTLRDRNQLNVNALQAMFAS